MRCDKSFGLKTMSIDVRVALEISEHPFDVEKVEEKPFKCCVCSRSFSGIGFLKAHFQRTHPNAQFHPPILEKNDHPEEKKEIKSTSKIFKSKFSSESASCSASSNPWFVETEDPLVCHTCDKKFKTRYDFMKHRFRHRNMPMPYGGRLGYQTGKKLICKTCKNANFIKFQDFKQHISVKCELCKNFHCKDWLYLKEICNKENECDICMRELCENCHILHMNDPIREAKSAKCVVCNEVCKDKKSLKEHYVNVHELTKISLFP